MTGKQVGPIAFEPLDVNVLKRGNVDEIHITGKEDFGQLYSIAVRQQGTVRNDFALPEKWHLERIELSRINPTNSFELDEKAVFNFGKWLTAKRIYDCGVFGTQRNGTHKYPIWRKGD